MIKKNTSNQMFNKYTSNQNQNHNIYLEVSNLYSLKGTMDRLDYLKSVHRYLYQIYQS